MDEISSWRARDERHVRDRDLIVSSGIRQRRSPTPITLIRRGPARILFNSREEKTWGRIERVSFASLSRRAFSAIKWCRSRARAWWRGGVRIPGREDRTVSSQSAVPAAITISWQRPCHRRIWSINRRRSRECSSLVNIKSVRCSSRTKLQHSRRFKFLLWHVCIYNVGICISRASIICPSRSDDWCARAHYAASLAANILRFRFVCGNNSAGAYLEILFVREILVIGAQEALV